MKDPWYDKQEMVNGVERIIYKHIPAIVVRVPLAEVNSIIKVTNAGPAFVHLKPPDQTRARLFRKWFGNVIPAHVALVFNQDVALSFPPTMTVEEAAVVGCPRKFGNSLLIGKKGKCGAHTNGCKAVFVCGLSEATCRSILDGSADTEVEVCLEFEGVCSHEKGVAFGSLQGEAREQHMEGFIQAGKPPSQYAQHVLHGLSSEQLHSNNRAHVMMK